MICMGPCREARALFYSGNSGATDKLFGEKSRCFDEVENQFCRFFSGNRFNMYKTTVKTPQFRWLERLLQGFYGGFL